MRKFIYLLGVLILLGCSQSSKIVYELDSEKRPDSVTLFKINGKELEFKGKFEFDGPNKYEISMTSSDVGFYKIIKHYGFKKKSLNFISEGNLKVLSIVNQNDSHFAYGSYETERLFQVLNHIRGCDTQQRQIQIKLTTNAMDFEKVNSLLNAEENLKNNCTADLIAFVRSDISSIASLYSTDYLDPAEYSGLIDSVFNETKRKYGSLYLHSELSERLVQN